MSNRTYLCIDCGLLRRASAVYLPMKHAQDSVRWPKHCDQPMHSLTYQQAVAATHTKQKHRVEWARQGLHILQRGGKCKWMAALNARQIADARQQRAGFLERQEKITLSARSSRIYPHML